MPSDPRAGKSKRAGLPLLWALPLALIVGISTWIPTDIALCGISGCGGGGFGVSWDPVGGLIGLAIGGALVALPIVLVRWTTNRALRVATAATIGVVFAVAGWIYLVPLALYR
jgi:hypothetical protein